VTITVGTEPWVGRALPRLEDEALLRGAGRFIDDLDPVPNVRHAAILRSLLPHARINAIDASAAQEPTSPPCPGRFPPASIRPSRTGRPRTK
jgi:hypothetical protein